MAGPLLFGSEAGHSAEIGNIEGALEALVAGEEALEMGQAEEALQHFRDASVWSPDLWQAYFGLGRAYAAMGENERARQAWLEGLKKFPDSKVIRNALDQQGPEARAAPNLINNDSWDPGNQRPPQNFREPKNKTGFYFAGSLGLGLNILRIAEFRDDRKASLERLALAGSGGLPMGTGAYDDPGASVATSLQVILMSRSERGGTLGLELGPRIERSSGFGWEETVEVVIPSLIGQDRDDLFKETLFRTSPLIFFPGSVLLKGHTRSESYFEALAIRIMPRLGFDLARGTGIEIGFGIEPTWLAFHRNISSSIRLPSLGVDANYDSQSTLNAFGLGLVQETAIFFELGNFRLRISAGGRWLKFGKLRGKQSRTYSSIFLFGFFTDSREVIAVTAPNQNGAREIYFVGPSDVDPRAGISPLRIDLGGLRIGLDIGVGF